MFQTTSRSILQICGVKPQGMHTFCVPSSWDCCCHNEMLLFESNKRIWKFQDADNKDSGAYPKGVKEGVEVHMLIKTEVLNVQNAIALKERTND